MNHPGDFEDEDAIQRALDRAHARETADLERSRRAYDGKADELRSQVAGNGRLLRPVAIGLMMLVLVPTTVTGVMFEQYVPIVVVFVLFALVWGASRWIWGMVTDIFVKFRLGERP